MCFKDVCYLSSQWCCISEVRLFPFKHDLLLAQPKFLPLPKDVKDGIAIKLSLGIPIDRILDGTVCSGGSRIS